MTHKHPQTSGKHIVGLFAVSLAMGICPLAHSESRPSAMVAKDMNPQDDTTGKFTQPAERKSLSLLFSCVDQHSDLISLYIDTNTAEKSVDQIEYVINIRQGDAEQNIRLNHATEYMQTISQAVALVINWKIKGVIARLEYHTDWQPQLISSSSIRISSDNSDKIYECDSRRINIVKNFIWRPRVPNGKRDVGFSIWGLSYYDLAQPIETEGSDNK